MSTYTRMGTICATAIVSLEPDRSGNFVCSGAADDVQIQAAITYVGVLGGGKIFIKAGTYTITATMTIPDYTYIQGEGIEKTILVKGNGVNVDMFRNEDYETDSQLYVQIVDITLSGNRDNCTGGSGIKGNFLRLLMRQVRIEYFDDHGMNVYGGATWETKVLCYGCRFIHNTGGGVKLGDNAPDNYFTNCWFGDNGGHQFEAEEANQELVACHFHSAGQEGVAADGFYMRGGPITGRIRIIGCEFANLDKHAIYIYPTSGTIDHVVIVGSTFWDVGKETDDTYEVVYLRSVRYAAVNNNVIDTDHANHPSCGIVVYGCVDSAFGENVIKNCDSYGIKIEVSNHCTFKGNVITACGIGIQGAGADHAIVGNSIHDNVKHGINLYDTSWCTIIGNSCVDNDSEDSASYDGIRIGGNSDNNVIASNCCHGNDRYQINIDGAACNDNLVHGNRTDDAGATGGINDTGTATSSLDNFET